MTSTVEKQSLFFRLAVFLGVVFAALMAFILCVELLRFFGSISHHPGIYRLLGLVIANLLLATAMVVFGLLLLWVRIARSLPELKGWHSQWPQSEFSASDCGSEYAFDDYLKQESQVFDELASFLTEDWGKQSTGAFNRYCTDSICNPDTVTDRNWNRSFVLEADRPVGGILLIHGLSDSPYSLRSLGQRLHAEGFTVVWLRVPGHGTSPGALTDVSWKDWTAAVKVAMKGLRSRLPGNSPMYLGGYSNGGALSVQYAIDSVDDAELPKVDGVVLFSPMIGISPLARITRLYHAVAMISRNQKARWSSISAEIEPYKYLSWPMNANVQAWKLTRVVEKGIARLHKARRSHELPPVLAMQSVVDSTVVVPKLITVLFDRMTTDQSELFLFDINRWDWLVNLFNPSFEQKVVTKLKRTDLPFRLSLLRNKDPGTRLVNIVTRDGESWSEQETQLEWPIDVVSLSHLAVPISPNDPIYGTKEATAATGLHLGSVSVRTEPSDLLVSSSVFVRCRHNPFYQLMEDRVVDWLQALLADCSTNGQND